MAKFELLITATDNENGNMITLYKEYWPYNFLNGDDAFQAWLETRFYLAPWLLDDGKDLAQTSYCKYMADTDTATLTATWQEIDDDYGRLD